MSFRAVEASSVEHLAYGDFSPDVWAAEEVDRTSRLSRFPPGVMLKVSFAETDFANRWWQHFGPSDGECLQRDAEYRVRDCAEPHSHAGRWTSYWFEKTDYNFKFPEWAFAEGADHDLFVANIDKINWGENYPN